MDKVKGKIIFVSFMGQVFHKQRSTINSAKAKMGMGIKNEFLFVFLQEYLTVQARRLRK